MRETGNWTVARSQHEHSAACQALAVKGSLPQPLHPDLREWVQDMTRLHVDGETVLQYLSDPSRVPESVARPPIPTDPAIRGWGRRFQLSLDEYRTIKSDLLRSERLDRSDVKSLDKMVRASQAYHEAVKQGKPPPPPPPGSFDPSSMIVLDYSPQRLADDGVKVEASFFLVWCSKWMLERGKAIYERGDGKMVHLDGKSNLTKYAAEVTTLATGDAGGVAIPLAHVLSADKTCESRLRALMAIFRGLAFLKPSVCMVDGELAFHYAVKTVSKELFKAPGLALRSCVFHIQQCVLKAKSRCKATEEDFKLAKGTINRLAKAHSTSKEQGDVIMTECLDKIKATSKDFADYLSKHVFQPEHVPLWSRPHYPPEHRGRIDADDGDAGTNNKGEALNKRLQSACGGDVAQRADNLVIQTLRPFQYGMAHAYNGRAVQPVPISESDRLELNRRLKRVAAIKVDEVPVKVIESTRERFMATVGSFSGENPERIVTFERKEGQKQFTCLCCTCDDPKTLPCIHCLLAAKSAHPALVHDLLDHRRSDVLPPLVRLDAGLHAAEPAAAALAAGDDSSGADAGPAPMDLDDGDLVPSSGGDEAVNGLAPAAGCSPTKRSYHVAPDRAEMIRRETQVVVNLANRYVAELNRDERVYAQSLLQSATNILHDQNVPGSRVRRSLDHARPPTQAQKTALEAAKNEVEKPG